MPSAHADELASVRSLLTATLPPYVLVTAEAQVSNVLTPERSTMTSLLLPSAGLGLGGAFPLEGGAYSTVTRLNPSAAFGNMAAVRVGPCPVPPTWTGRTVTVSAWVATARAAGALVVLQWLNAAGVAISGAVNGSSVTGMDVLRRSTASGVPPAGAVACRVEIQYAEIVAQPQVTWTDGPVEWSPGNGADRVVITGLDRDTELQVPDSRHLRRASYSLNLTEVGP